MMDMYKAGGVAGNRLLCEDSKVWYRKIPMVTGKSVRRSMEANCNKNKKSGGAANGAGTSSSPHSTEQSRCGDEDVVQTGNILYRTDRQHRLQLGDYAMART